ncbi:hypothetical protein BX600DRAFT_515129 [Xylariales sp. PMI_506]|nr:hypothetical protein BX600DRAFT_515129 [Xylariales sp. PMI_506]
MPSLASTTTTVSAAKATLWPPPIRTAMYAARGFILVCLVLFSALSGVYFYTPTPQQRGLPMQIITPNVTANAITCGYPTSGLYGLTPTTIFFFLLPAAIASRKASWLSTTIAASVMVTSSLAAIHLMVLFAFYSRFSTGDDQNSCRPFNLGVIGLDIPICYGTHDPDYIVAGLIDGAGLLAIFPIATWSSTFKETSFQPVLTLWAILLAVGHVFFILILPNPNANYQFCPTGSVDLLPGLLYQAVSWDATWEMKLASMVSGNYDPSNGCIYSCFTAKSWLGRLVNEIAIWDASISNRYVSPGRRVLGVFFWSFYTLLSATALAFNKPHDRHRIITWDQCLRLVRGIIFWKHEITTLPCPECVIMNTVKALSACAYLGFVGWAFAELAHLPYAEPFSAVGQWSNIVVAVLVLIGAGISQLSERWQETGQATRQSDSIELNETPRA